MPEPEAPIRQTTSCSPTSRSTPLQHLVLAERLADRPRAGGPCRSRSPRASARAGACRSRAISQSVSRASGIVSRMKSIAVHDVRRVVERRGDVDLRLAERLDRADQRDERRVLLQPDEVVQERRDHAADRLRDDHEAQRLDRARARASARRPPGSGAPTRSRRGRPRPRTRSRRGRARRSPRRAARSGTPESCEGRRAEAEHVDHEDRRHAAEEVGVDRSRAPGAGRTPAPGGCAGSRSGARRRG